MKDYIFDEDNTTEEADISAPLVPPKTKSNFLGFGILLGIMIIAGLGYMQSTYMHRSATLNNGSNAVQKIATSSPDSILLTINGRGIPRKLFTLSINNILQIATAQKLDVNRSEVQEQVRNLALANVVNTQLLSQKAKSEGKTVDNSKVKESIAAITVRAGSSDKLAASLKQIGMTTEELSVAVGDELLATEYINAAIDTSKLSISEVELKKRYADLKASPGAQNTVPAYKDIRDKLKGELLDKKRQQLVQEYLAGLRKDAKIELVKN